MDPVQLRKTEHFRMCSFLLGGKDHLAADRAPPATSSGEYP